MQRMQRKFGLFLKRTPNEGDIASMLRDFDDADQMLAKIADAAKAWRDAWTEILNHQLNMVEQLHTIYKPLAAKGQDTGTRIVHDTPREILERVQQLQTSMAELKSDMVEELKEIDSKLILPAKTAKDSLKPFKKTMKKREDKKLDYERYTSRVNALHGKSTLSDRERTALAKHEMDLERSKQEYLDADENLRTHLPKINAATFGLIPHLLANQIVLQNNLLGNIYTVLNEYCAEHGFPSPPPELEEVIPVWDASFTSLRMEVESGLDLIAKGKAIHQPMRLPDSGSTVTGLGIRNKVIPGRRTSSNSSVPTISGPKSPRPGYSLPPTDETPPLNLSNKPSISSLNSSKPGLSPSSSTDPWGRRTSTASSVSTGTNGHDDYFARPRIPSTASSSHLSPNATIGKKKPPPPPPKKIGSWQGEFVTAMYDFEPQNPGDLALREGDKIRVLKKTNSSQDWWEGELRGKTGSFPANYCK